VTVALPARAKLNLDLAVIGRRPDGMHDLRTTIQAVDLHDLLEAEASDETTLTITGDFNVSTGAANTVLKALHALEESAGRRLPTAFRLNKRIPPGSGLGGASSDAAAALRALKYLHRLEIDLAPIAFRVGADVSFFLSGGGALVEGIGERVTPTAIDKPAWYAIAWPGIEVSTADVYRAWDEVHGVAPNQLRRAAARVDRRVDEFAQRLGAGWQMTGSGSAFFCVCPDRASAELATRKLDCWTAVSQAVGAW
jgi:4-diphosphocytidyl-2-C-methyl-D-erythritol kinase